MSPVLTEEQMDCNHIFEDVTEERRKLVSERGLPGWARRLIEKEDPRWVNRPERWKTLKYEKCRTCGLLKVFDEEVDIQEEK